MFVIATEDRKCIVKGKSKKYLCCMDEKTRKELVSYDTEQRAKAAIMRMMPIPSDMVKSRYGAENAFRLTVWEVEEDG